MSEQTKRLWRNLRQILWHGITAAISAITTILAGGQLQ